ncbi:MAG: glutathione S-transferase [Rhodobacteraceae bacterium]|nr:glutathione S-transferase [Paracoccaceae bacterium]
MKLYYAPNTRAVRVAWLLEELGLEYDIAHYKLGDPAMRGADFLRISPLGRVPVLEDGDARLLESGAIVQYILARHAGGRLQPAVTDPDYPDFLQWLHFAEGMLMPPINTIVVETVLLPPERRTEINVKRATKLLGQMLTVVDRRMKGRDHLLGDFSAADIMTGHAVMAAGRFGADLNETENLAAYAARLAARPALQRAEAL